MVAFQSTSIGLQLSRSAVRLKFNDANDVRLRLFRGEKGTGLKHNNEKGTDKSIKLLCVLSIVFFLIISAQFSVTACGGRLEM